MVLCLLLEWIVTMFSIRKWTLVAHVSGFIALTIKKGETAVQKRSTAENAQAKATNGRVFSTIFCLCS